MRSKSGTLKKKLISIFLITVITLFFIDILFLQATTVEANNSYVPPAPSGVTNGDINIEYRYSLITYDIGSYWMFDWGDGNYSDWILLVNSDTYVSDTHFWDSYGTYNVRIKHNSTILGESSWSEPLVVTISPPTDYDNDGWSNEIEEAFNKNPKDPTDFPLDTDGDGTQDYTSADGSYIGDLDDDNDGLFDTLELSLGLNSKNKDHYYPIIINDITYFLLDNDYDGKSDILYNAQTELFTKTSIENGKICLDINRDGAWDYTFYNGIVTPYEGPFPWLYVIIAIIAIVFIIIFILFKTGVLYLYKEDYKIDK